MIGFYRRSSVVYSVAIGFHHTAKKKKFKKIIKLFENSDLDVRFNPELDYGIIETEAASRSEAEMAVKFVEKMGMDHIPGFDVIHIETLRY